MGERLRGILRWVALPLLVATVIGHHAIWMRTGDRFGVIVREDAIETPDFVSHFSFAKAFWGRGGGYGVEDHLRMTEGFVGHRLPRALPFGYSPTMLWLLGPLCLLPTLWAFAAWTLLSLAAVWGATRHDRSLMVPAVFVTPVAVGCWWLGQTAVLTTAALLALQRWDAAARSRPLEPREVVVSALVVWALSAKPPLAVAAATALLAGRRIGVVAAAAGAAAVSTALLLPWLGKTGIADYLFMLSHYDRETAPAAFAWSLYPETMGNVRALLNVTFGVGDAAASRWSTVLWLLASTGIAVAGARRAMAAEARWALAGLAYLLFCPHVSWTEELALGVALAALPALTEVHARTRAAVAAYVLVMLFLLPGLAFQGGVRLPVAVAGKLWLAGVFWIGVRTAAWDRSA